MNQTIELGNHTIEYELKRSKRKSMGIEVNAKGQLVVTAPDFIPQGKVDEVLKKKSSWILEKIAEKKENYQVQPKRKYVSGESIYLFGRQYYLKVIESDEEKIEKAHNRLMVHVRTEDNAKKSIEEWSRKELERVISEKLPQCINRMNQRYSQKFTPEVKVRKMNKRWGSCKETGTINLSTLLAAVDPECIEYVIYHELTHIVHPNHGEQFYSKLGEICPNYQELKNKLESSTIPSDI